MNDIKTLRQYARCRKLPLVKLLGTVSAEWTQLALTACEKSEFSNDQAYDRRSQKNLIGTRVENYTKLVQFYSQKIPTNLTLDPVFKKIENITDLRFAILQPRSQIPHHIDDPSKLRFICMLQGEHVFSISEIQVRMKRHELWYVNGSFPHAVSNELETERICLLGNFSISGSNLKIIEA